jgi:hypothetical protein
VAALSVLAYARLGLITREDLSEVSAAILSKKQISMIYPHTRYILSLLYGEDRTEE